MPERGKPPSEPPDAVLAAPTGAAPVVRPDPGPHEADERRIKPAGPDEAGEPDKTDMSAVGDDGQVFGG
jgi:hypothetical protein